MCTLTTASALFLVSTAAADTAAENPLAGQEPRQLESSQLTPRDGSVEKDARSEARELVENAQRVVEEMRADPEIANLLDRAEGIFIVPHYAEPVAVIGGRGGEGVVLVRQKGTQARGWSSPAFFDFGSTSLRPNVGAKAGSFAMLMMTPEASDKFRTGQDPWTLEASDDQTIANYSTATGEAFGEADMVLWSNTAGSYAGADISINNISSDEQENQAFYSVAVDARQILAGGVSNGYADELREALGQPGL
tara:strand:- start:40595 stop:41347 length:753 start_codon:yes stop_codon:yes gene_type:complete